MSGPIKFTKLSGSGNDFICIDGRDGRYDRLIEFGQAAHLAQTLCRRGLGIGADGLIFAQAADLRPDVKLLARFFEPDGSEAELCGNGTACFVYWALAEGWAKGRVKVLTSAGLVHGQAAAGKYVRVCIPTPRDIKLGLELSVAGRKWVCDYIVVGVPHLAAYVEDVGELEVAHWGPLLRRHARFAPRGVNVNFVQVPARGRLAVRTFEFGVEGETLACGTGSAGSAILASLRHRWPDEYLCGAKAVRVRVRGGDVLWVYFTRQADDRVSDVCLETIVRPVCAGSVHPALAAMALGRRPSHRRAPSRA